jgi:hypothetical protein
MRVAGTVGEQTLRAVLALVIRPAFKEPVMVRLVPLAGLLALAALLVAGCGGGGSDQAKVEANLQHYVNGLRPELSGFPMGLGLPKVKANSCSDRHIEVEKRDVMWSSTRFGVPVGIEGALWGCVVKLGTYVTRVNVVVVGRAKVVGEWEGMLFKRKCLADQKAKGTSASRAYPICAVILPPIHLRKPQP